MALLLKNVVGNW